VDAQPQAVAQAVHVALGRSRAVLDTVAWPSTLKQLAGALLVIAPKCQDCSSAHDGAGTRSAHFVQRQHFIGGVAQAPGAGEIVVVPAASLARENIEHNRLAQAQRVAGMPEVRHAGIAPDGEDGAFRVFGAALGQPQVDQALDISDGQGLAVGDQDSPCTGWLVR
jgi:hypothetical protein